jgi:DNA topoisomerase-1
MRLAQSLYESGHITYMRTDSVSLSALAINTAKAAIVEEYGDKYHKSRQYHTKSKGAQEAHEAIRPSYMNKAVAGANSDERKLYDLIRKRAIASQMADAQIDTTRVEVAMSHSPYLWTATHEVVTFDGFMRAYTQSTDEELTIGGTSSAIAQLKENVVCQMDTMISQESFTKPPMRYSEGSLIKKMEDEGIGRPATYQSTIDTIQSRKYVEYRNIEGVNRTYNILTLKAGQLTDEHKTEVVGADTGKLVPTDLGRITNDFLVEQFPHILSYDFTAQSEESFDAIAAGEADWVQAVDDFYQTFHPLIQQVPTGKMAARLIGNHPETGEPVLARITKNGPCVQIGDSDDKKPQFASLLKGQSIFTITMEEALDLFRTAFPYTLTQWQGKDVVIGEGKFGPYVRWDKSFVSIPKTIDPHAITPEQAIALLEKNQQLQEPIHIFGNIQVLHGRYGAYIKTPEGNFKIPRSVDAQTLTEEQCREIIANTDNTPKERPAFTRRAKK